MPIPRVFLIKFENKLAERMLVNKKAKNTNAERLLLVAFGVMKENIVRIENPLHKIQNNSKGIFNWLHIAIKNENPGSKAYLKKLLK